MMTITESGMEFGPFAETECFVVENSRTHKAVQPGVQIAEFLVIRAGNPSQVWIVEAKSSTPNPASQLPNAGVKFADFITEIRDKLTNALVLGVTACMGRHPAAAGELPPGFAGLSLGTAAFRFVLVVNGHKEEWLPPLHDAMVKALRVTSRTWGLGGNSVVVLNDKGARARGLIV
jgi:hypothetical protein